MKIEYKFADGTRTEVEVSEEVGAVMLELDRLEYNNNQTETRRHTTLNNGYDDGEWLAVEDTDLAALFDDESKESRLHKAITKLNPKQQHLIKAIYFDGMSVNQYAANEGVQQSAISHRLQTAKNKLKKLF